MTNLEFSKYNSKITLSVLSVLLFSFLLVIFFMNTYGSSMEDNKIWFYHQVFDTNEKKIFLISSSQTGQLNEKINHRESFRPFAPSILDEHVSEYFDIDTASPYMLLVAKVKKPDKIPAVTHIDGTGRLQSVSKEVNPLYYDLINEFYKLTGVPVIINTSMNVMGEPIVNTPEHAHTMILKTDMDYIVLGNYIIDRQG